MTSMQTNSFASPATANVAMRSEGFAHHGWPTVPERTEPEEP